MKAQRTLERGSQNASHTKFLLSSSLLYQRGILPALRESLPTRFSRRKSSEGRQRVRSPIPCSLPACISRLAAGTVFHSLHDDLSATQAKLSSNAMKTHCHHCQRVLRFLDLRCPYCHQFSITWRHFILVSVIAMAAGLFLLKAF
jgi:hypothetical protein